MKISFAWSLVAVGLVGASALACSQPVTEAVGASDSAIVGGVEAQEGAWPGTVAVYFGNQQGCGGSLVADKWVLTAGHCIISPSSVTGGVTKVVVGRHKLSSTGGETINVKKAYRHPGFDDQTLDNDLALLELVSPSSAPTVKLTSAAQLSALVTDAKVTVVGWGLTRENGAQSDVLREVEVPIISNEQCGNYPNYDVTANQLCAGLPQGGKDSCQGDSGGPLFMKFGEEKVQVGLVSWGIGCARANAPGVYTRLGNYVEWLSQTSGGDIPAGSTDDNGGSNNGADDNGGSNNGADDNGGSNNGADDEGGFTPFEESGSVSRGEEKSFSFDAPAGTYVVAMTGSNDADLYVKKGSEPTLSSYDCRPYVGGSNESCTVTLAEAGTIHVLVRGYGSGSSSFTLKGTER